LLTSFPVNKKYWESISLNTKSLERNPKHLGAYYDRAMAYDFVNKPELAAEDRKTLALIKRQKMWKAMAYSKMPDEHRMTDTSEDMRVAE
jgi:hypothetical protein